MESESRDATCERVNNPIIKGSLRYVKLFDKICEIHTHKYSTFRQTNTYMFEHYVPLQTTFYSHLTRAIRTRERSLARVLPGVDFEHVLCGTPIGANGTREGLLPGMFAHLMKSERGLIVRPKGALCALIFGAGRRGSLETEVLLFRLGVE